MSAPTTARPVRAPWLIVARREIMVQLTDKAFWIGTVGTIGLIVVSFVVSAWMAGSPDVRRVAVADADALAIVQLAQTQGQPVEAVQVAADQLAGTVERGDADGALRRAADGGWELAVDNVANTPMLGEAVRTFQIGRNAAAHGVDPAAVFAHSQLAFVSLSGDASSATAITVATFAFAILFMLSAMTYGMQIAQSVVTEKESRIVEILAAAVPLRSLLVGKVVGNAIMALGQVVLIVTVALIAMTFTPYGAMIGLVAPVAGWFILFFLVGFASLACLWAAAGAMATRVQDLGQTTTPLTMIVMLFYMLGLFATGTTALVLSYVPIASAVVMPGRLLTGQASWVDALGSLVVSVVFMVVALWIGERVYRRGLLQTGSVMKLKDALSTAE